MSFLYEELPDTVTVGSKAYPVYTDFRDWLRFFDLQEETCISDIDKHLLRLRLFKEMPPLEQIGEALDALIAFAANTKTKPEKDAGGSARSSEKVLSWSFDAPYIYAAFLSVYSLDLLTVEYMHWHVFLALFHGLPDDVPIKKRMGYRATNTAEIKDKNEKKRIQKIQNNVRIPQAPMDAYATGEFFG